MKHGLLISIISFFVMSCTYNKKELPKPDNDNNAGGNIPTITYTSHAKAIIDTKCSICHSTAGTGQPPFMDTYTGAFNARVRIIGRAVDELPTAMPPANPLPQNIKDTLQMWLDQGALQ